MTRGLLTAVTALTLALAGCYGPAYRNGGLRCSDGICPEGYYCAATSDHCWKNGTVPPLPDGLPEPGPPDAGPPGDTPPAPRLDADLDHPPPEIDTAAPEPDVPIDPLARLSSLTVEPGTLEPAFSPTTYRYDLRLPLFTPAMTVTAVAENPAFDLSFNNTPARKGMLMLPRSLSPGIELLGIEVTTPTDGRAKYGIAVNTGGDFTYVKASNTHAKMAFGTTLALAGNLLVVGAPNDKSVALGPQTGETPPVGVETGAAFVFARTGTTWRREVTLKPLHLNPAMRFGAAVAVYGDVIVVGAPGESGSGTGVAATWDGKAAEAGAAFVFARTADGWAQQAYLKASDTATGDQFGSSVAVAQSSSGGVVLTTVAVGAPGAGGPGGSPRTGAAYVFVRTGTGAGPFMQQAMPKAMNPKGNNEFGATMALAGETLVVGAPREDSGASGVNPGQTSATAANSGAAYIFTRNGTTWPQPVYVKAPVAVTGAYFGSYVAIAGQFMAVAAPLDPGSWRGIDPGTPGPPTAHGTGAVFLYHRNGNTWSLLHQIKPGLPHNFDSFGRGLALSASTLVVGAPFDDANESGTVDAGNALAESGAIYVFRPRADGLWSQLVRLKAPNAEANDQFGIAVATDGDTVAAGADGESSSAVNVDGRLSDNGALGSGAVYLY